MTDSIIRFADQNPFLTFFLFYVFCKFLWLILRMPFRCLNIWKHGWPPAHLDADGDLIKIEEKTLETEEEN